MILYKRCPKGLHAECGNCRFADGCESRTTRIVTEEEQSVPAMIDEIIERNGAYRQVDIAIEEMSELTKELIKYRRYKDNKFHVQEEIGDVYTILLELCRIYDLTMNDVMEMVQQKLNRTIERMNHDE